MLALCALVFRVNRTAQIFERLHRLTPPPTPFSPAVICSIRTTILVERSVGTAKLVKRVHLDQGSLVAGQRPGVLVLDVALALHADAAAVVVGKGVLGGLDDGAADGAKGAVAAAVGLLLGQMPAAGAGVALAAKLGGDAADKGDDEGADRGQAGADDADVDLDGGPDGEHAFYPRGVGRVDVVGDERLETDAADDSDTGGNMLVDPV